jgi:hypothetical protein
MDRFCQMAPSVLRSDYAAIKRRRKDPRPPERLIAHYELECRLADRLRAASRDEPHLADQL